MVFILLALWWIRIRSIWKLPGGRDWLRGKLGLVLMCGAMLSKSLIQLSVDGRGCVPSLLFHLRPLPLFIFCSLCHLNSLSWFKNSFHMSSGSEVKASAHNVGDLGSIPGLGRSSGEGSGNPLQYSCLENPMDGGVWWATVHGVTKSQTRLSKRFNFYLFLRKLTYFLLYNLESLTTCSSPLHQKIVHRHRFGPPEGLFGTWNHKQGAFHNEVSILEQEAAICICCGMNGSVLSVDISSLVTGVEGYDIRGGSVSSPKQYGGTILSWFGLSGLSSLFPSFEPGSNDCSTIMWATQWSF